VTFDNGRWSSTPVSIARTHSLHSARAPPGMDLVCEDFSDDEDRDAGAVAYQQPLRRAQQGASSDSLYGKKMVLPGSVQESTASARAAEVRPQFSIDQLLLMPMLAARWLRNEDLSDVLKPTLRAIPAERLASFTPEQVRHQPHVGGDSPLAHRGSAPQTSQG
jgi:hypothetical protein